MLSRTLHFIRPRPAQRALLAASTAPTVPPAARGAHTAESYFKDDGGGPPQDAKVNQVDGSAARPAVQHATHPASDDAVDIPYEDAAQHTQAHAYDGVSREEPYKMEGEEGQEKTRYLAKGGEEEPRVSSSEEGPEKASKGGRGGEGR